MLASFWCVGVAGLLGPVLHVRLAKATGWQLAAVPLTICLWVLTRPGARPQFLEIGTGELSHLQLLLLTNLLSMTPGSLSFNVSNARCRITLYLMYPDGTEEEVCFNLLRSYVNPATWALTALVIFFLFHHAGGCAPHRSGCLPIRCAAGEGDQRQTDYALISRHVRILYFGFAKCVGSRCLAVWMLFRRKYWVFSR